MSIADETIETNRTSFLGGMFTGFCLAMLLLAVILFIVLPVPPPDLPRCKEDEIIIGLGNYDGETDLWESYTCYHIGNFLPTGGKP